jgi:glycerol-3-phosphate O-acyltransferase
MYIYQPTGQCYEEHNYCHPDSKFFDYQKFGIDFTRPLVDWENSKVIGADNLAKIKDQLARGENVIFFSNHQSESDTHCIFTLFEDQLGKEYGKMASDIVFMAGERVLRDAIVVPFSRGCNLLTVYSKKHIDSEPEMKPLKMTHNQAHILKSMKVLSKASERNSQKCFR